mmetsp:Transcript_538/g.945  ORF Transcript_538/g.945 Transcript_538/m.945 type:complete len:136 (+) Transcript_538:682-1089(+)
MIPGITAGIALVVRGVDVFGGAVALGSTVVLECTAVPGRTLALGGKVALGSKVALGGEDEPFRRPPQKEMLTSFSSVLDRPTSLARSDWALTAGSRSVIKALKTFGAKETVGMEPEEAVLDSEPEPHWVRGILSP